VVRRASAATRAPAGRRGRPARQSAGMNSVLAVAPAAVARRARAGSLRSQLDAVVNLAGHARARQGNVSVVQLPLGLVLALAVANALRLRLRLATARMAGYANVLQGNAPVELAIVPTAGNARAQLANASAGPNWARAM